MISAKFARLMARSIATVLGGLRIFALRYCFVGPRVALQAILCLTVATVITLMFETSK